MKGYYECSCGETYISDFPFQQGNCLECGERIDRKNFCYYYGRKHFIPYAKLTKFENLAILLLRSDKELGFFDFEYPEYGFIKKFPYSHAGFYDAMENSEADIFKCVENGKLYIPCEHELFIYEGRRDKLDEILEYM